MMLAAVGCGQLRKPPDPDRRLDVKTSGALFESDTGYKFAALPEPGAGVIRMTVRYPVGTMDDPVGKAGLSHLVEHLVFEIEVDRNGKKTSIGAELGRIALWSNAVTNADSTDYEALIPPEALDDLVRLEVERLGVGCAGLTPEIFAREREVVLNELRQKQGARGAELSQLLHASIYPAGHPYRVVQSVESVSKLTFEDACAFLGGPYRRGKAIVIASGKVDHPYARTAMTEDSLDNISRDDVMSWARDHIVPGNSIVVIAGKFDPELVKQHIAYNSDQVSQGSDSRDLDATPATKAAFISGVAAKDSPTVEIDIGFVGGSGIDRNYAKRLVLAGVLDAQLAQLRAKRALSYGFSASYTPRDAGGLWSISGEVDAARAAEAATAITAILEDLRANPETYRTAFVLARQKVLEELVVNTTSAASMVGKLAYLARFDLPDSYYNTLAMAVAAMTLADFHPFLVSELAVRGQVFGAFGNQDAVTEALRAAQVKPAKAKPGIVDPFQ